MLEEIYHSPIGNLSLKVEGGVLQSISKVRARQPGQVLVTSASKNTHDRRVIQVARKQLDEFFDGKRKKFDLPLAQTGTPFQRKVWGALRAIPHGQVRSYGEIAHKLGADGAARAVGSACGANPFIVVVPCHRVVASNGGLGGFSGGLPTKKKLLSLESN